MLLSFLHRIWHNPDRHEYARTCGQRKGAASLDFRKIRSFLQVAETLSFAKAARNLYISQSAVTQHIQSMEEEIGFPLLERDRNHVGLTPEGRAMQETFRSMLELYERGVADAARLGNARRELTVAYPCSPYWMNMPAFLMMLREQFQTEVRTQVIKSGDMLRMFTAGAADLLFCHEKRIPEHAGQMVIPLFRVGFHVILPAGHRLSGQTSLVPGDLRGIPVFCAEGAREDRQMQKLNEAIRGCGLDPAQVHLVPHREDVLSAVATGQGAGLAPADLPFGESGQLVTVPFHAPGVYIPYACVVRRTMPFSAERMAREVRRFFIREHDQETVIYCRENGPGA